jgi:hypothetical protein
MLRSRKLPELLLAVVLSRIDRRAGGSQAARLNPPQKDAQDPSTCFQDRHNEKQNRHAQLDAFGAPLRREL